MELIVNLEVPFGLTADAYIEKIGLILGIGAEDIEMTNNFQNSTFWILHNVEDDKYEGALTEISDYARKLYNKGRVTYFYMGQYDPAL